MKKIKKILCPVELWEEKTNRILDYAATLAKAFDAEIIILHVTPKFDEYARASILVTSVSTLMTEVMAESEAKMKKVLANSKLKDIKVSSQIVNGLAADEILAVAKKQKVDVIIMGTHGRKGMDHLLFGSVAEKVVRTSEIPVMTVRPE